MMDRAKVEGSIGHVVLGPEDMVPLYAGCGDEAIVSAARVIADRLAETSGKLGLVAYYDNPDRSDLIQFRLRRAGEWKRYDLRDLLGRLSIDNGGGHEGAIGFRIPRDQVPDFSAYVSGLMREIEKAIAG
jgi:single-stranded DNA-specific DHH superfamily exonuclease